MATMEWWPSADERQENHYKTTNELDYPEREMMLDTFAPPIKRAQESTGFNDFAEIKDDKARFITTYQTAFAHDFIPEAINTSNSAGDRSHSSCGRGIKTSGLVGEVYKCGSDPQHNTLMQRVWLPTNNLIIEPIDQQQQQGSQ